MGCHRRGAGSGYHGVEPPSAVTTTIGTGRPNSAAWRHVTLSRCDKALLEVSQVFQNYSRQVGNAGTLGDDRWTVRVVAPEFFRELDCVRRQRAVAENCHGRLQGYPAEAVAPQPMFETVLL